MVRHTWLVVLLVSAGWASEAAASGLELEWNAPVGCPDAERVRSDIQSLLGRELGAAQGDDAVVTANVSEGGGAWLAVLTMAGPGEIPNERRIEGRTCREVADATAAIVALALVTPREPAVVPPKRIEQPKPKPRPPPVAAEPQVLGGVIAAFGGVDFAALPSPTAAFGLSGALRFYERNRVELRAAGFLPQAEEVGAASVDVSLFAGALRYCRALFGSVAALTVCGGFEGGVMVASARGFDQNDTGFGRWLAPELALALEVHPIRALGLSLEVEGLAPIARDYFLIDEDRIFRSAPVDGRILLGVSFGAP